MESVIKKKLQEIEEWENVKIIMAVETGSRVWDFGSPDSVYHVRFIFLRNTKDYLRLDEVKDSIEWKFDDTLVMQGYDLKKFLHLLHDGDPTVYEWCSSTIVYHSTDTFEQLKALVPKYFSKKQSLYYYWNTACANQKKYLKGSKVRIKNYFSALRALLAVKWILNHNCPPPIKFLDLVNSELPKKLRGEVYKLLEMKKATSELGYAIKVVQLNEYIEKTLEFQKSKIKDTSETHFSWSELNYFFKKAVLLNAKKV